MRSCKYLKEEDEAKVGEDGHTKHSHDPSHHNIAEDVCTQKECHTYKRREREGEGEGWGGKGEDHTLSYIAWVRASQLT